MTNDLQEIKTSHDALPGPSATATAKAKDLLAAEMAAERTPAAGSAKHRLLLRTAAVGLAAAVAAVAFLTGADGGTTPANAAELLQEAATAAGRQQAPRTGQFVYVKRMDQSWILTLSEGGARSEFTQEVNREAWIPVPDPRGALTRSTYGKWSVHSGQVPAFMPTPGTVAYHAGQCAADALPTADTANLPTDPDRLLAQVRADAESSARNERPEPGAPPLSEDQIRRIAERTVAGRLVTLAQNPFPGPGLREAVLGALSKLPTATMRTDLTDPAGRQGVGASIRYQGPEGWERTELIFEPGTYRFLGWRDLIEPPGGGAEELRLATAILEIKVVDAMPKIPADAPEPATC